MSDMKCPKCGFIQPEDSFCANCGISVANFKVTKSQIPLRSRLKPIFISLAILALIGLAIKIAQSNSVLSSAFNQSLEDELTLEQKTLLGTKAGSLPRGAHAPPPMKASTLPPRPKPPTERSPPAQEENLKTSSLEKTENKEVFDQVQATVTLGEVSLLELSEAPTKGWIVADQIRPIKSLITQNISLKIGQNTFNIEDNSIRYYMVFDIQKLEKNSVQLHINIDRLIKINGSTSTLSADETLEISKSLAIIDHLPRFPFPNNFRSLLSTLYTSQLFLSEESELMQIIKFQPPSASQQIQD